MAHVRGGLAALGVGAGDRVALLCGNGRYFVVAYLATLGLGAVAVPLNPASPSPEIERELATVGAKVVVVEPSAARALARRRPGATCPRVRDTSSPPRPTRSHGADCRCSTTCSTAPTVPTSSRSSPTRWPCSIFTSGTAGSPRAAMLSHGNLLAQPRPGPIRPARSIDADDVVYGVLPMFHIFGLNVVLGLSLARGATVVLVQRFDPSTALDTIRERSVTVVPGAPPLWLAFSHMDDAPADSFATVRLALTGAAKMPEEAMRRLQERFGLDICRGLRPHRGVAGGHQFGRACR